jgi:hypothetical protein
VTWGKLGQEWPDEDETAEMKAPAKGLYSVGLCISNRVGTDGLLRGRILQEVRLKADFEDDAQERRALKNIVRAGAWHDHRSAPECPSDYCSLFLQERGPVPKGAYLIHEFHKDQPSRKQALVPIEHLRWLRDNDLRHNRRLCEQIQRRDRDLCRYCGGAAGEPGVLVKWADHRSDRGGTYDHVDPWCEDGFRSYGNTLENVVTACKQCNGRKKDRTPEQWVAAGGRPLLPPPGADPTADPIPIGSGPDGDPTSRARGAQDGTDRDPTQSRSGPDSENDPDA